MISRIRLPRAPICTQHELPHVTASMQKRHTALLPNCHGTLDVFSLKTDVYYELITSSVLQPHAHYICATYIFLPNPSYISIVNQLDAPVSQIYLF
jgi:hypothetical protein